MDLQVYYQSIRGVEATIPGEFAVIVSLNTKDGGREGVRSEVSRYIAARAVVENWARLATEEETAAFRQKPAAEPLQLKRKNGKD